MWDFLGKIGTQIISFGLGIFLARLLSPREYGLIGLATIFIAITGIFSNLGLSTALIQKENPTEAHYSSSFFLNISVGFFLFGCFFLFAPLIAIYFNEPQLTSIVRILSIGIVLSSFNIVQNVHFSRNMQFKQMSKIKIINIFIAGSIGLTLAINGFGVWSLVFQTLIGGVLNSALLWYFSDWKPKWVFEWKALKELWGYGFKMFISGLLDTLYNQLSSLIIAKFFSAKDLGLYSRAESLNRFVIKYSSESVSVVTFPSMSRIQGKKVEVIALGKKTEILVAFLSFGLLGLLYVSSESLILFLLGKKWSESIVYYKILCLSGFAFPISSASLNILKATGNSSKFLEVEAYKKIVGLIGLCTGFYFGVKGYLFSLIFTGAVAVLLNMYFVSLAVSFSVKEQLKDIYIYAIISVLCTFVVINIPLYGAILFLNLIQQTLLFGTLYFLCNYVLKTKGLSFVNQLKNEIVSKKNYNDQRN